MHSESAPDPAGSVLDSLRHIVRALRATSHAVERELGIGGAQLFVLRELKAEPGISIRRISERTLTDPSSASVVVGKLLERGLIVRKRDPSDGRKSVLSLTPRGQGLLNRAPEPFQARLVGALRALPAARLQRLDADLAAVVTAVGAERGAAPMFFDEEPKPKRSNKRGS
jgi:DNA-binding MarR family transcriptional regulator